MNKLEIRKATEADLEQVLHVEREAFGHGKEADLVDELLADPTAKPLLSLLAVKGEQAVGHVLFTTVRLSGSEKNISAMILAPLAVVPEAHRQGVGSRLVQRGLELLTQDGVELVFVLGHPTYYPRFGFEPAGRLGFEAAYPIPDVHADAWMVQALQPGIMGSVHGKVVCADALTRPEHWRE